MKVVFYSNFLNHHQYPFCCEMIRLLGEGNFVFVATMPLSKEGIKAGYPSFENAPFLLKSYKSAQFFEEAESLALSADVVLSGITPTLSVKRRLKDKTKLTLKMSERWFKIPLFKGNLLKKLIASFIFDTRYRYKNVHMLCASAFQASDCHSVGAYPKKTYKWGYFPQVPNLNIEKHLKEKNNSKIILTWCARFIPLKHPEMVIGLANELKHRGYNFLIRMIGGGELFLETAQKIKDMHLDHVVKLIGNVPNNEVLEYFKKSDVFLFTSDRNEGWGAVLNEAMSCGCMPIASDSIGSAPFLIDHGVNGLLFKSGSLADLVNQVTKLLDNPDRIKKMSLMAYKTMDKTWNPRVAAENLVNLCQSLLKGQPNPVITGPCSPAK